MVIKVKDEFGLHNGFSLKLTPGFTALVGPNGAGKTTLLRQIEENAKKKGIKVWRYSNLTEGGNAARQSYLDFGKMDMLMAAATASEGEQVALNFSNRVGDLGKTVRAAVSAGRPLFVLLDAIDSGASIDRARELKSLFDLIYENDIKGGAEVYVIMAVNHYELVKDVDCVNVRSGKHVKFGSYDEYADFICTFEDQFPRKE